MSHKRKLVPFSDLSIFRRAWRSLWKSLTYTPEEIVEMSAQFESQSRKSRLFELNSNLLSAAVESGRPLYLTGNFGGFGGAFYSVHRTFEDAKDFVVKSKLDHGGMQIFKVDPEYICFIANDGQVIEPGLKS